MGALLVKIIAAVFVITLTFTLAYNEFQSSTIQPATPTSSSTPLSSSTPSHAAGIATTSVKGVATTTVKTAVATSTKTSATKPKTKSVTVAPKVVVPSLPTEAELQSAALSLRSAIVNIICVGSGSVHSMSGTGVLIDPRGIILTNAHVAQYFLLMHNQNLGVSCVVRTGSPARSAYKADLIFISPAWVHANPAVLTESRPTGNGQYDYAFLGITESVTATPLPASFPSVSLGKSDAYQAEPVVIGAYAAQFLTANQIIADLYPTIVFGSIQKLFTFGETTVDIFSLGGSAAAQEGSSGGGVIAGDGTLLGVITTSTLEDDTAARNLGAISTSYLRRQYVLETGTTLETLFSESVSNQIANFSSQISALASLIVH